MQIISLLKGDPAIANRYLADQLAGPELANYETQLLKDPDVLRELEATARFKLALRQLRANGQLAMLVDGPRPSRLPFSFAAAALFILVLTVGLSTQLWRGEGASSLLASSIASLVDDQGGALPIAATYALMRTRSTRYDAVIDLPPTRKMIVLRALPSAGTQATRYRALLTQVLDDGTSQSVASVDGLRIDDDGFVTLYADSSRLAAGDYRLVVTSDTQLTATDETFLLKVKLAQDIRR